MPAMELMEMMLAPLPNPPLESRASLIRSWLAMLMFSTMSQNFSGMLPSILSRVTPALWTTTS